uniref:Uncharacterized protein n=1 Tax=Chlamydomonas leiostraca TaxID=1034604 RepID=A0A7S0WN92_9CHLO|mmetsp:Transcript_20208/g.51182  ORF Transcript_20208/g.51182 Transcript_20208/m.51182 type:complete len:116 (+) Transcript_20208:69-416(+)
MAVAPSNGKTLPQGVFSSGLCSCFDDMGSCIITCCVPCVTYGQNVERLQNGSGFFGACLLYYCCACCACFFAGGTRGQLRQKYGLKEDPCSDCCVHCWCSPCGLCQEARELKARG